MKKLSHYLKTFATLFLLFNIIGCQTNPKLSTEEFSDQQALENSSDEKQLINASTLDEAVTKAHQALQTGSPDLALIHYINAFSIEPTNTAVLKEMAILYKKLQNQKLVATCYRLILEQEPDNITIQQRYGLLLIEHKQLPEAQRSLNKVVAADTTNWESYNGLGVITDLQGKHKEAQEHFKKAISNHQQVNPKHAELLNNMGYSLYMDDQFDTAQDYYVRALKINPRFKKALYNYALIVARQKRYDEAVSTFSKVTSLPEANNNTGYIAMVNNDLERADYYFKQALKLSPRFYQRAHKNLVELDNRKIRASVNENFQVGKM